MKLLFLFTALLLAATAHSEEVNDTAFNVKDKKIVVDVQNRKTIVTVYSRDGYKLSKTREMEYVDGQEVEQVYVGSPLIPIENLQNLKFKSFLPTIWYGFNYIGDRICSARNNGIYGRRHNSFEIGITPWSFAVPFNKSNTLGLVGGVQLTWVHMCFDKNYAAGMQGDRLAFTQLDMKAVGNNMNYGTLRIPVMFSMQQNYSDYCCNIGFSVEMRTNGSYRFSPAAGSAAPTVPDALKLNRFGLNFDFSFCISSVYCGVSMGLTPLYQTTTGAKAYYTVAHIGINLPELIRLCKSDKKKK